MLLPGFDTHLREYSPLQKLVNEIDSIARCAKNPLTLEQLLYMLRVRNWEYNFAETRTMLETLERMVPDWFCKKSFGFGDLYYLRKNTDLNWIRLRVEPENVNKHVDGGPSRKN